MRLKRLDASGFRGFPGSHSFDLDADAIIISGVNGSGKTSFFDAFLWALSGSVTRLATDEGQLVSKYSQSGETRVELTLRQDDGSELGIVRRFDGESHLTVKQDGFDQISGSGAETALIEALWPDALSAADPRVALDASLTRATYLQQDSVRDFVQDDDEATRFRVVGELVGVGRIAEMQRQLESSRNAWTRASTTLSRDLEPLLVRRQTLQSRLSRLTNAGTETVEQTDLRDWLEDAARAVGTEARAAGFDESSAGVDRSLQALTQAEQTASRRLVLLEALAEHLRTDRPTAPDLSALEAQVATREVARNAAAEALADMERVAAAHRRAQVELSERAESLRALAELAMQHLGPHCPVCGQEHDPAQTRALLQELVQGGPPLATDAVALPDVSQAAARVETAQRELSASRALLAQGQSDAQSTALWDARLASLAGQVGLDEGTVDVSTVDTAIAEATDASRHLADLRRQGERVSLGLAQLAELAQRDEMGRQLESLNREVASKQATLTARQETGTLASTIIEALRDANNALVSAELERIEPLLQRIFATVDPHPSLRLVGFLTRTFRGQGQLWTTLDDSSHNVSVNEPGVFLSSSQLNVLAVATYLAFNLSVPTLPLQVVALDDPLQSLDTVNLLGLADLLRRVKGNRQVVVSTHDVRLADLLERKLRPVASGQRSVRFDFRDWTVEGPIVETTVSSFETPSLRLVESA
jgi:DNA repair exonuclease SbcCD ATPase subunit